MDDQRDHNYLAANSTDAVFEEAKALCAQFESSGRPEYLDLAIGILNNALKLVHTNQPEHATYLDELAALHMRRYERYGKLEDINKAVDLHEDAVSATAATDSNLPKRLQRMGDAFQRRYEDINNPTDIERSIECHRQAVMISQGGHENTLFYDEVVSDAPLPMINDLMSTTEVLGQLMAHGCSNLTSDIEHLSEYPVGGGGLGDVYKGKLRTGSEVAVKTLRMRTDDPKGCKALLKYAAKELYAWSKCDHPNVLELLGLAEVRGQIAMVSPWMVNGDVGSFLRRQSPTGDRCSMCAQVAEGLVYLHANHIVHGDVKGLNVLVSSDHMLKLTDFGNAALIKDYSLCFAASTSTRTKPTTLRWTAPEIMFHRGSFTSEADVYALGSTILEILTGLLPFNELKTDFQVMAALFEKTHPERPEETIPSSSKQGDMMWSLLVRCWDPDPEARPKAVEVRDQMIEITPEGLLPKYIGDVF
ncbi:hypothetical protein FRC07_014889 [Ceratobasidium sp. 392]|nr:hypothetical protein FRC07_014889 [Ceratobasidium sp. 392]